MYEYSITVNVHEYTLYIVMLMHAYVLYNCILWAKSVKALHSLSHTYIYIYTYIHTFEIFTDYVRRS